MNKVKHSHLILERGQVMKLDSGNQSVFIDCTDGSAWVTASKDPNDYVLKSGERLELPAGSKIVIQGLRGRLELDIEQCA